MPLPLFLGAGAAIAGAVGITNGLKGAANAKNASDRIKSAERQQSSTKKEDTNNFQNIFNEILDGLKTKPQPQQRYTSKICSSSNKSQVKTHISMPLLYCPAQ